VSGGPVAAAYAGCRARITELVTSLSDEDAATPVPTCPRWTVHDVVAHASGVVDDVMNGRLDGVASDPWTAAQVDARRDKTIAEMIAEWEANAPGFEGLLDSIGDPGRQAVADVVTHEHDIRTALGQAGARDSDAVAIGFGFMAHAFVDALALEGVSLRVEATDGSAFGQPDAAATLRGAPFELLRAMTGRRSVAQLRDMEWAGDPDRVLASFAVGPFRPAEQPIEE
jgi:uncharacterized protein (TIGR03083 family)